MGDRVHTAARRSAPSMRAYVLQRPGVIELQDVPRPEPEPDGVVVRVCAALTCGTDLKAFLRGHPKFPMPTPFGHEFAGEVVAVGREVRRFHAGDAVMAAPTAPCGSCYYCRREQENLCPQVMATMVLGAYGEYVHVPGHVVQTNMYRKPDSLSFGEAALLEPLACVLHGLAHVRIRPDDTVVIIGAGAFALLHVLVLRHRGVGRVVVVTRSDRRATEAQQLGAAHVIIGGADGARDPVQGLTEGRGADVVIECTGQVAVWERAPDLSRPGGQVMLFGGCPAGSVARFDTGRLHYDQVRLVSPFHFTPRDVRAAYELLGSGTFPAAALLSGTYPLEALEEALARLQRGEGAKFVILPRGA